MKIYVICASKERDELSEAAIKHFNTEDILFVNDTNHPSVHDEIVISHAILPNLKGLRLNELKSIHLFFAGRIVSVDDGENLVRLRQEAIDAENWVRAKSINDILIDINFIRRNTVLSSMPDYLQIETTSFCNAKCIMCSHYFSENRGAANLGDTTLENLKDAVQLSHTISLNGMGEPFISDRLSDQIDYYASMGNRIVTNTNLSILNDRLIDQINNHFEWLEVSCDGATKETYESIRKGLNFDVFLKNLFTLKERCPNVRKHIATVIMRQNVHEMPQMVELAYQAGASIITFMTLNSNIVIQNQVDEMCHYPKVLEYYSVQAVEMGKKYGIPVIVPNSNSLNKGIKFEEIEEELSRMNRIPLFKSYQDVEQMKRTASTVSTYLESHDEIQRDTQASQVRCAGICDWLLRQSYIDLKGNAAMCCRNQSFHTGNVNESGSFSKVWNSTFYQKLRKIFYSGFVPESCLKCGLVESGNLKFLNVQINADYYQDPAYKIKQKETLRSLLGE